MLGRELCPRCCQSFINIRDRLFCIWLELRRLPPIMAHGVCGVGQPCAAAGRFFSRIPPAIEPGSMVVLTGAREVALGLSRADACHSTTRRFHESAIRHKKTALTRFILYTKRVCRSWLPHALPHSVRTGYPHTPTQGNTTTLKRRQGAHTRQVRCGDITGIGGPSYDAWRRHMTPPSYDASVRHMTPPSYDASGPSYDTTVI